MRALEVFLGISHRDAGFQSAEAARAVALIGLGGIPGHGDPHACVPGEPDFRRHHADDRMRHSVQFERAAEHVGRGREAVAPQALADHHHALGLRAILFWREGAAKERPHAEDGGEVVRDGGAFDALGAGAIRQVEALAVIEGDAVEERGSLPPLDEVREVDADDVEVPPWRGLVDVDEAIGLGKGEGPQEQSIHEPEHDDVGSDSQSQHAHDEGGRELLPRERPERVLEIRTEHEHAPFVDGLREARSGPERPCCRGAQQVPCGQAPDASRRQAPARAGRGEGLEEEICHFLAVAGAQGARSQVQQRPVQTPGRARGAW